MDPRLAIFLASVLGLVVTLLALNALLSCARELKAIRQHLDRLTPEALLALKSARRTGTEAGS
jgi:uncharacterized membrane protein YqgA involved in biofilm formation